MFLSAHALADPDEAPRERDMALFIGRNAHRFLPGYRRGLYALPWSWPAFLVPVPWLLYRKMYVVAFAYVGVIVPLALVAPGAAMSTAAAFAIGCGLMAKHLYLQHARRRVLRADARGLIGVARDDYLRRAGGVSLAAAVYGILVIVSGIVLGVLSTAVAVL